MGWEELRYCEHGVAHTFDTRPICMRCREKERQAQLAEEAYHAGQDAAEIQQEMVEQLKRLNALKPPQKRLLWGDLEAAFCANCRRTIPRPSGANGYDYAHFCRGRCYRCNGHLSIHKAG